MNDLTRPITAAAAPDLAAAQTTQLVVSPPMGIQAQHGPAVFSLQPRNFEELMRYADILADSEYVPKDYRGKPGNVIVAIQWGAEVGLKPLQAMQNIAVINGRPSMWGDACLALVRASGLCEYCHETTDGDGTAICQVKRRGEPEQVRTFSDIDAATAGLKGKDGPWRTNPKRMKQMRARAFALRDVFTDVLKGLAIAEEAMDIPPDHTPTPATLGPGNAAEPSIPPALLAAGKAAARKGKTAYAAWWGSLTYKARYLAEQEHDAWKQVAIDTDAAMTQGTGTPTPEQKRAAADDASGDHLQATTQAAADIGETTDEFRAALDRAPPIADDAQP